jgi:aminomethyltransferase
MLKTTPLLIQHQAAGAKLVDFSGWQMPLHYGSQIQEHHAVRHDAGIFDVSHMAIIDVTGQQAVDFLRYLLANDVAKLNTDGKALYTCMLNPQGGIIDDLIVSKLADNNYRLVLNAGTREKDWAWLQKQHEAFDVHLNQRTDLAMIAIQGPNAITKLLPLFDQEQQTTLKNLPTFHGIMIDNLFFSRTGYTGEDGFEVHIPANHVNEFWQNLLSIGFKPCGLGARDTLRLEAGLNLYGTDMDESTTPLESNLAWTVAFNPVERDFIGRANLEAQRKSGHKQMVGIILESPGVLRSHQNVLVLDNGEGQITSGTFSPTLGHAIALARLPASAHSSICEVEMRHKRVPAIIVKPPFVRHGQRVYQRINER